MNPLLRALVAAGVLSQPEAERINRQLDPVLAQQFAEREIERAFANGLTGQQRRILDVVRNTNGRPTARQLDAFWTNEDELLHGTVEGTLQDIASERAIATSVIAEQPDLWRLVNQNVLDWVDDYYINADRSFHGSIPNLNLTSRTRFAAAFRDWQLGELEAFGLQDGLPQLIRALTPVFGPERAELIGVTETTRIFAETTRQAARSNEFVTMQRWLTSADERVCPICGPLHGQTQPKTGNTFDHPSLGAILGPPAHPRCRCIIQEETAATANLPPPREERFEFRGELPDARP